MLWSLPSVIVIWLRLNTNLEKVIFSLGLEGPKPPIPHLEQKMYRAWYDSRAGESYNENLILKEAHSRRREAKKLPCLTIPLVHILLTVVTILIFALFASHAAAPGNSLITPRLPLKAAVFSNLKKRVLVGTKLLSI